MPLCQELGYVWQPGAKELLFGSQHNQWMPTTTPVTCVCQVQRVHCCCTALSWLDLGTEVCSRSQHTDSNCS